MPEPHLNDFRGGTITYNGFTFPALEDVSLEIVRVPDESGLGTRWNEWNLSLSFVYYPTSETLRPFTGSIPPDTRSYKQLLAAKDVDARMGSLLADMRSRLEQPGQELVIDGGIQGSGWLFTIGGNTAGQNDLNNGPVPGPLIITPIASDIVFHVQWSIKAHARPYPCSGGNVATGVVSMNFSSTWEYGEDNGNLMTRTVMGTVVTALSRQNVNTSHQASKTVVSRNGTYNKYVKPIIQALFPKPGGFKRQRSFSLDSDYKTFKFSLVDTEIMSDVPYPQPILEMKLRQRVKSNLDRGFEIWSCTYSGTVTVAKSRSQTIGFGTQKQLAWVAIGRMIYSRLQKVNGWYKTDTGSLRSAKIIIDDVEFDDGVNENDFNFSLQYRVFADHKTIFSATGMFQPLRLPGATWQGREDYFAQINTSETPLSPIPVDTPPIVEIWGPNNIPFQSPGELTNPLDTGAAADVTTPYKTAPKEDSYIGYSNDYDIYELNASSVHTPIWDAARQRREELRADNQDGFIPTADRVSGGTAGIPTPVVHNPTARTYIIRMYGYAIRAGVPATPPNLVQYGGKNCTKIGVDKVKIKSITRGVAMNPYELSTNIFGVSWSKEYIVHGTLQDGIVALRSTDRDPSNPNQVPPPIA